MCTHFINIIGTKQLKPSKVNCYFAISISAMVPVGVGYGGKMTV